MADSETILSRNAVDRMLSEVQSVIRPSKELESKANLVILCSIALLGLSLVPDKPHSFALWGFTFDLQNWIWLGDALGFALGYFIAQLDLAWRADREEFKWAIRVKLDPIEVAVNEIESSSDQLFKAQNAKILLHSKSILWTAQRREELSKQLDEPDTPDNNHAEIVRQIEELVIPSNFSSILEEQKEALKPLEGYQKEIKGALDLIKTVRRERMKLCFYAPGIMATLAMLAFGGALLIAILKIFFAAKYSF